MRRVMLMPVGLVLVAALSAAVGEPDEKAKEAARVKAIAARMVVDPSYKPEVGDTAALVSTVPGPGSKPAPTVCGASAVDYCEYLKYAWFVEREAVEAIKRREVQKLKDAGRIVELGYGTEVLVAEAAASVTVNDKPPRTLKIFEVRPVDGPHRDKALYVTEPHVARLIPAPSPSADARRHAAPLGAEPRESGQGRRRLRDVPPGRQGLPRHAPGAVGGRAAQGAGRPMRGRIGGHPPDPIRPPPRPMPGLSALVAGMPADGRRVRPVHLGGRGALGAGAVVVVGPMGEVPEAREAVGVGPLHDVDQQRDRRQFMRLDRHREPGDAVGMRLDLVRLEAEQGEPGPGRGSGSRRARNDA